MHRHAPQRLEPRASGFTLLELILVLALLAGILAFSAPSLKPFFQGHGLADQARRLQQLTRFAYSEAISKGVPYKVWIEPETGRYGAMPVEGYGVEGGATPVFRLDERQRFDLGEFAADDQGQATIVFRPDGLIESGSLESVEIVGPDNRRLAVRRAATGSRFEVATPEPSAAAGGAGRGANP